MTQDADLADYRWLIGEDAENWLQQVAGSDKPLHVQLAHLRKDLSVDRASLVAEQVELRRRGRVKFSLADRMFFTTLGLQQATDEVVAAYKSQRFVPDSPVADLCCGIGGDLIPLNRRCRAVGVDRDPVSALFAQANCLAEANGRVGSEARSSNTRMSPGAPSPMIHTTDVNDFSVEAVSAWHIDPDRRPQGRRTTRVEFHSPSAENLEKLLARNPNGAIKLAPAALDPESWAEGARMGGAELEWISSRRECRQLVVWFGDLAKHPRRRKATVLGRGTNDPRTLVGEVDAESKTAAPLAVPITGRVDRFVFEPDAAVLAAGLSHALAEQYGLSALSAKSAYLTGGSPIDDPALACFEVTEVLPYKVKQLRPLLRQRRIGRLEVKKRGVPLDPDRVRRELRVPGDHQATLLLTPLEGKVIAILAQRAPPRNLR